MTTRRAFARTLATGLGAAIVGPARGALEAALPPGGVVDRLIQLDSNENPYGPSRAALDAVTAAHATAARYPDRAEAKLAEVIARHHGVDPENVVLGCGSGDVLRMADAAFLGPEKKVVVSEPTFEAVLNYARVTHAEPVKVPQTSDFRHDLPRMAEAAGGRAGLVYVCNPNNPTGTIVTRGEVKAFLARLPESVTVLVDEAYHHFVEDERYASAFEWVGERPNLVVVRTFSKIYGMAGMRLGYAVASREKAQAMRAYACWSNANGLALAAALASLDDDQHVPRQRRLFAETRAWLTREMEKDGRRVIPSHTNFMMIDVGGDVAPIVQAFRQQGVLVGRRFPSMSNWLRVSIGTAEEMRAFVEALRAIVPARSAPAA